MPNEAQSPQAPPPPPSTGWLERISAAHARIRDAVVRTPVERASEVLPDFDGMLACKLEHRQRTGSFKLRGAANRIARLSPDEAARGVTTSSMGNHGLGVAFAATAAGVPAEVFVSERVASERLDRIRAMGAAVRKVGTDPVEAELAARDAASESGRVYISPYNDVHVIEGQGTLALELTEQMPGLDAVFVAVGGGGLVGGVGAYLAEAMPGVDVVGCWPQNAPALHECMLRGRVVDVAEQPTLSESTAGGIEPGSVTVELARRVITRSVLVSEDEILAAMRLLAHTRGWVVEGAAGVALAGFLRLADEYAGQSVAVVLCGGNVSPRVRALVER